MRQLDSDWKGQLYLHGRKRNAATPLPCQNQGLQVRAHVSEAAPCTPVYEMFARASTHISTCGEPHGGLPSSSRRLGVASFVAAQPLDWAGLLAFSKNIHMENKEQTSQR